MNLNLIQCKIGYTSSLDKNTPVPLGLYSWLGHSVQSHPVLSLSNTFVQCNQLHLLLRDQLGSSNTSQIGTLSCTCLGQLIERDQYNVQRHHDFCIRSIR